MSGFLLATDFFPLNGVDELVFFVRSLSQSPSFRPFIFFSASPIKIPLSRSVVDGGFVDLKGGERFLAPRPDPFGLISQE